MITEYLYHHGIKGQKWGVRRFQNEDGSVTSAGAKRYYVGDNLKKTINDAVNNKKNMRSQKEIQSDIDKVWPRLSKMEANLSKAYNKYYKDTGKYAWFPEDLVKAGYLKNEDAKEYADSNRKIDKLHDELEEAQSAFSGQDYDKIYSELRKDPDFRKINSEIRSSSSEIQDIYDKYTGDNSKYRKEAFDNYYNNLKKDDPNLARDDDDVLYGFNHYYWGGVESGPEYKEAHKLAKKEAKELESKRNEAIQSAIDGVVGDIKASTKGMSKRQIDAIKDMVSYKIDDPYL